MIELVCRKYPVTREQNRPVLCAEHLHLSRPYPARAHGGGLRLVDLRPPLPELFADPGGSCLVKVAYTDMMQAAALARQSGGAVVLAHPGVYDSF